ncbi:MAG: hypothetical protein V1720_15100 [bacterium]
MKNYLLKIIICLFILGLTARISAQSDYLITAKVDSFKINFENYYPFSAVSVIPGSEKIVLRNRTLQAGEYQIFYSKGYFTISDSVHYSIFDTVYAYYQTVKISLKKEYKRRSLVVKYEDKYADSIRIIKTETTALSSESIFGPGIEKSGSLIRGFTVGTNRDFTVNSGLRLQISGTLSDDIEVVAALTDENTPIQPEGNTERLEELDKVFIEIRHPNAVGVFGDYDLKLRSGEFGKVDRKLQGLKGTAFYEEQNLSVSIAGSRGKFNTAQFNGIDGVQGPYRLYGINNERNIIVIAGSEKIFFDGNELKRGENNDYTIEYASAEITFTPNRLITSASRITVDYEYTDRQFQRNFFGANYDGKFFNDKFKIGLNFFREGDDETSPIDISISDEDKKILEAAGDDKSKAVRSGVSLAQPDSLGRTLGTYTQRDTVISNITMEYYIYNPGADSSLYNVSFSYVGEAKGNYIRESLGNYKFVGINQGNYLPIIYLPLPELKQTGNIFLTASPWKNLDIGLEFSGSLLDQNKFSSIDDGDNFGHARNIQITLKPDSITIGTFNLGKIGLTLRDRFINKKYSSIDRVNDIEFSRYYNSSSGIADDEVLREVGLTLQPIRELLINSKYGYLKQGSQLQSNRYYTEIKFSNDESFNADYVFDYVNTKNSFQKTDWIKQNGEAWYKFGSLKPGIQYLSEIRKDKISEGDSLMSSSLEYIEIGPFIELIDLAGFNLRTQYTFRNESYPINGTLVKESSATTKQFSATYKGIKEVSGNFNLTIRNKNYTKEFEQQGQLSNETILIRSQTRYNLWSGFMSGDYYYETATQRTAKREKVFIQVPVGTGNYTYLGDLNNNGVADENEYQQTVYDGDYILTTIASDELFPVIDFKTNLRWEIDFSKILKGSSLYEKILLPITTEIIFKVEEKSKEQKTSKIYLMNFSSFLNDSTTIAGSNYFQQDINIFKTQSDISIRLRYTQKNSLNQYSGGMERNYYCERSARIRFKMVKEINNQTEYVNEIDNSAAPLLLNRSRVVTANSLSTDFSYRPENNMELGFKIKVGRSEDDYPEKPTIIDQNSQTLRFTLSLAGEGRLRVEIERNELNSNSSTNSIPFEITRGNTIGKNYFWRLNFDYKISGNLQTTVSYDGRLQGAGKVIHTMRAEARAYF